MTQTRREFIKCVAGISAAVMGVPPFNIRHLQPLDSKLVLYPFLYETINGIFRVVDVKLWGCNWDCRWCTNKFHPLKGSLPIAVDCDRVLKLVKSMNGRGRTLFVISGGEPLLQKDETIGLIRKLKRETNFIVSLETNGSLLTDEFVKRVNRAGLDRMDIAFRHIDDGWHRWYTGGYSNKVVLRALKLATDAFDGLIGVPIILFPEISSDVLDWICKVLYEINPDFVIRLMYPIREPYIGVDEYVSRVKALGSVVSRYFYRIFPDPDSVDPHLPRRMVRYRMKASRLIAERRWEGGGELA